MDSPIVIKPPPSAREYYLNNSRLSSTKSTKSRAPSLSDKRAISAKGRKGQKFLRSSNVRNPKDPTGRESISFKQNQQSSSNSVDWNPDKRDDDGFYRELRKNGMQQSLSRQSLSKDMSQSGKRERPPEALPRTPSETPRKTPRESPRESSQYTSRQTPRNTKQREVPPHTLPNVPSDISLKALRESPSYTPQQTPRHTKKRSLSKSDSLHEYRDLAEDASLTKTVLQDWKKKIQSLEDQLKEQTFVMRDVLADNEALEKKVAKVTRKSQHIHRTSSSSSKTNSREDDRLIQKLKEENKALEMEVKKMKLNQFDHHAIGDDHNDTQAVTEEWNKLRKNEKKLSKALSIAQMENERLLEEVDLRMAEMEDRDYIENEAVQERDRLRRNETLLERELALAQRDNKELLEEVRSRNLDYQKLERQRERDEEEIRTLRSDLEMNRRIVHTKRSLIQKEFTDASKEKMREEMTEYLTMQLTSKITEELESKMRDEKETALKELRKIDEQKVHDIENQVPILENEIDRLRLNLGTAKEDHERKISNIESSYQKKIEFMVENFTSERERENLDSIKRVDELSAEIERTKERAAKEKEEHGNTIREEMQEEMEQEVLVLTNRIAELTKESIDTVEKLEKEKKEFGDNLRQEFTKERDELLEEAAKEKESHGESIRKEVLDAKNEEIDAIQNELDKLVTQRQELLEKIDEFTANEQQVEEALEELESYVRTVGDLENERDLLHLRLQETDTDLQLTKENYAKDIEALEESKQQLKSFRSKIAKLEAQKQKSNSQVAKLEEQNHELTVIADQFKNDYIEMKKELEKIKGHFKFAVLVEYEEKLIEMEDEVKRLEGVVEESKTFNRDGDKLISEQFSKLHEYKKKEQAQDIEIKRLSDQLMASVSDLESKELRLIELKDIIQKKETENSESIQQVKDLKRSLGACEIELARVRNEQEIANQRIPLNQEYEDKITSLSKELAEHKSRLEHCRCDGKGDSYEMKTPESQAEESEHLRERVQRLSVMLKVAERNQTKQQLNFDATKEMLEDNLNTCEKEIEGLHSEVSRLTDLLGRTQKDLLRTSKEKESRQVKQMTATTQTDPDPKTENDEIELLDKIETAEKVVDDAKQYRSDSEKIIQQLKDQLNSSEEGKQKVEQDLLDQKLLFREAIISWRIETKSLKKQLGQLEHSRSNDPSDGNDTEWALKQPEDRSLQYAAEERENGSTLEGNESLQGSDIDSVSENQRPFSPIQNKITAIDNYSNPKIQEDVAKQSVHSASSTIKNTEFEVRDDEDEPQSDQEENKVSPTRSINQRLEISEHTCSIEMIVDSSEGNNASTVHDTLQDFKNEYKQYLDNNGISESITQNIINLSTVNPHELSAKTPIAKNPRPPQPHFDGYDGEEDSSMRSRSSRRSLSTSISKEIDSVSKTDARDDSTQQVDDDPQKSSRDTSMRDSSLPQQQHNRPIAEGDESTNSRECSERSRKLRQKMSDLLVIKNNIKKRSNLSITTADTKYINGRVAKSHQQKQEGSDSNTSTSPLWGLAPEVNPKLYSFLKSKSKEIHQRRNHGILSKAPTDENMDRRDVLPFDEEIKIGENRE